MLGKKKQYINLTVVILGCEALAGKVAGNNLRGWSLTVRCDLRGLSPLIVCERQLVKFLGNLLDKHHSLHFRLLLLSSLTQLVNLLKMLKSESHVTQGDLAV